MRLSVRLALFGSFLLLTVLLVLGQVLVGSRGLRQELHASLEQELGRELELVPSLLPQLLPVPAEGADPDSLARALSRRLGYPVTLLDLDGRVLGASSDLPFQLPGLSVLPQSPELRAALQGDVGFSRRRGAGEVEIRLFAAMRATVGSRPALLQVAAPLDQVERAVRRRALQSLALAVPALLLALLLTWGLEEGMVRPLHTLARRARGLAVGNFSRRVPRTLRITELDELAGTFNRMTEELQSRFTSLEGERDEMQALIDCMGEAVIALTPDARVLRTNRAAIELLDFPGPVSFAPIGALVRQPALRALLEGAVRQPFSAREVTLGERHLLVSARPVDGGGAVVTFLDMTEIRRLETVRKDFVANASHELKTPLTALRGFAETLLEDDVPPPMRSSFLQSIRDNTLRLQRLVDDLLDLSRLESGGWRARKEEVDLGPLVEDIVLDFAALAEERGVAVELEGGAMVLADPQGLEQVLKNLVDNAIRYTPAGGRVRVEVREGDPRVRVAVRDTGVGIPSAALPRIFERFYRVDPARSRAEGGTGLGLAIVRHLVHAMGGEVWAESELGQGTTVFFTLAPAPAEGAS